VNQICSYPDKSTSGATKLHLAVWNEDVDKVKKLVQKNDVNVVNAQDGRGRAPLHLAAEKVQIKKDKKASTHEG
jgi:ankyrin repeat protein